MEKKKYYQVNWIDGMKINKNHFIEMENAFTRSSQIIGSTGINKVNYGLLPYDGNRQAVGIVLSMDGNDTIKVTLNSCKAITRGGFIIDITEDMTSVLKEQGSILKTTYDVTGGSHEEYYVVLKVNPYIRVPFGDAIPGEEPPRHPYVLPEYTLTVVNVEEANSYEFGEHHLTIGKIGYKDDKPVLLEDFIPPCLSMQSHQDLKYIYSEMHAFFNTMEKYAMSIIQRIYQKKQSNDLASMILTISQNMLQHIGGILPEFRLIDTHCSPVVLVTKLMGLSRVTKNSIDIYVGTGKEELLNYLSDWSNFKQGELEKTLIEMIEMEYQHTDMNKTLHYISNFTKQMLVLFKTLSELDYIGKKSDSNIFVKEEVITKDEVKNRRSFLLD